MWSWRLVLTVSATQQAEAGGLFELSLPNSLAGLCVFLCFSQSHSILAFWASSDNHHLLLQVRLDLHRQSSLWQTLELRTQFTTSEFENVLVLSFLWYQEMQAFPLAMWSPMAKFLGNKSCHTAEPEAVPLAPLWLALNLPLSFQEQPGGPASQCYLVTSWLWEAGGLILHFYRLAFPFLPVLVIIPVFESCWEQKQVHPTLPILETPFFLNLYEVSQWRQWKGLWKSVCLKPVSALGWWREPICREQQPDPGCKQTTISLKTILQQARNQALAGHSSWTVLKMAK